MMKTIGQSTVQAAVLSLMLAGCYLTREPVQYRDEYFRPIAVLPQRNHSTLSSTDLDQLKNQIESATKAVVILRDSLASLQQYSGSLLISTRALVDKVSELETKEYLTTTKQKDVEQSVMELRAENKQLSRQLAELRTHLLAKNVNPESSVFSPVRILSSLQNEYEEGLSLFHQRQYEDALVTFDGLKDKGIEEDLADNCEYWIGECRYAKREYREAINAFQKVLALETSNKKIDAYFMMGKSYELIGDFMKARWAYEELNAHFPDNNHASVVKSRLNALKQDLPAPKKNKHKKTTA
jgi:TolA-binding protein